jgi:hypothetical protein
VQHGIRKVSFIELIHLIEVILQLLMTYTDLYGQMQHISVCKKTTWTGLNNPQLNLVVNYNLIKVT